MKNTTTTRLLAELKQLKNFARKILFDDVDTLKLIKWEVNRTGEEILETAANCGLLTACVAYKPADPLLYRIELDEEDDPDDDDEGEKENLLCKLPKEKHSSKF